MNCSSLQVSSGFKSFCPRDGNPWKEEQKEETQPAPSCCQGHPSCKDYERLPSIPVWRSQPSKMHTLVQHQHHCSLSLAITCPCAADFTAGSSHFAARGMNASPHRIFLWQEKGSQTGLLESDPCMLLMQRDWCCKSRARADQLRACESLHHEQHRAALHTLDETCPTPQNPPGAPPPHPSLKLSRGWSSQDIEHQRQTQIILVLFDIPSIFYSSWEHEQQQLILIHTHTHIYYRKHSCDGCLPSLPHLSVSTQINFSQSIILLSAPNTIY